MMLAVIVTTSTAQTDLQRVEGGIFGGISVPLDSYHKFDNRTSSAWGIELRYNLKEMPLDIGISAGFSNNKRRYCIDGNDWINSAEYIYRTWQLAAVSDWNFKPASLVNPFVGLGLGVGLDRTDGWLYQGITEDKHETHFMIMPRAGVELVHHIRLTADMRLGRKPFNAFCLTLGLTLGGRPKKVR